MSLTKSLTIFSITTAMLLLNSGCSSKNISIIGEKRVDIIMHKSVQEGNFLKIVAELENDDNDETEGFVYQVEWYDKNGIILDTTPWKPITIHKNQKVQVVELSTRTDVVDYKIIVSVPNK